MKLEHDIKLQGGNTTKKVSTTPTSTTTTTTMSLYQLQELASRQHDQIETTKRLLQTKEQRLNYLAKMEDSQQAPLFEYDHSFAQFKEKLALQEAKLRKLRLLRGQVQKQKCSNSKMCSELETVRIIYREKERELSQAMTKIEALTRQLEELKKGNIANSYNMGAGYNQHSNEMERLRQELLYKTKMCNQKDEELMVKQSMLFKRNTEIVKIDKRINELQGRLARKRQMNQQLQPNLSPSANSVPSAAAASSSSPSTTTSATNNNSATLSIRSSPEKSPANNNVDASTAGNASNTKDARLNSFGGHHQTTSSGNTATSKVLFDRSNAEELHQQQPQQQQPSTSVSKYNGSILKYEMIPQLNFAGSKHDSRYQSLPYSSKFNKKNVNLIKNFASADGESHGKKYFLTDEVDTDETLVVMAPTNNNTTATTATSSDQQHRSARQTASAVNAPAGDNLSLLIKAKHDKDNVLEERPSPSGSSGSSDRISSSLATYSYSGHYDPYHKEVFNDRERYQHVFDTSIRTMPNGSPAKESPMRTAENVTQVDDNDKTNENVTSNDVVDKAYLLNHRRIYEQYLESEQFNKQKAEQQNSFKDSPGKKASPDENGNEDENARNLEIEQKHRLSVSDLVDKMNTLSAKDKDWKKNKRRGMFVTNEMEKELHQDIEGDSPTKGKQDQLGTNEDLMIKECERINSDKDNNNVPLDGHNRSNSLVAETTGRPQQPTSKPTLLEGILKKPNETKPRRNVCFDPLALLLDASLEGELDLVKKTSAEVRNPSTCNDEGITAMHNATCASHFEIVKYLVEIGCDVNAQDSDGWTPLHCAASCNNLVMIKFLVQSGACIFATTFSDQETAAEKCEEDEENFDGCSQYLYGVQDKLGIANNGMVYAVYDYQARNNDELSFKDGDALQVLRKGDEREKDWWWARAADREGYIACNLIGLYPRIKPSPK